MAENKKKTIDLLTINLLLRKFRTIIDTKEFNISSSHITISIKYANMYDITYCLYILYNMIDASLAKIALNVKISIYSLFIFLLTQKVFSLS